MIKQRHLEHDKDRGGYAAEARGGEIYLASYDLAYCTWDRTI